MLEIELPIEFMIYIYIMLFVSYVFSGIGLMKITKKLGEEGSWMAWVPIFNFYLIGKLAFTKIIGLSIVILTVIFSINIITEMSMLSEQLTTMILYAVGILLLFSLHKIYSKFSDKANIMLGFTVLSGGLLASIFLFAIRNNEIRE